MVSILNIITKVKSIKAIVVFFCLKNMYVQNKLKIIPITNKVKGRHQELHLLLKKTSIKDIKMVMYNIGHTIENT